MSDEPDIDRISDQHIKPCRGCGELILWAKCIKKDGTVGKVAPLVKAKGDEKPNIIAWFDEDQNQWFYKIKGAKSDAIRLSGQPEYVNHYMNCLKAAQFKK